MSDTSGSKKALMKRICCEEKPQREGGKGSGGRGRRRRATRVLRTSVYLERFTQDLRVTLRDLERTKTRCLGT